MYYLSLVWSVNALYNEYNKENNRYPTFLYGFKFYMRCWYFNHERALPFTGLVPSCWVEYVEQTFSVKCSLTNTLNHLNICVHLLINRLLFPLPESLPKTILLCRFQARHWFWMKSSITCSPYNVKLRSDLLHISYISSYNFSTEMKRLDLKILVGESFIPLFLWIKLQLTDGFFFTVCGLVEWYPGICDLTVGYVL